MTQRSPILRMYGFTLMEMVVVIVIVGIVFAIGSLIISRGFTAYFASKDITNADWQARLALERMTRELREIRLATGGAELNIASATQISFTDIGANVITYSRAGNSLMRNAQVLADNVSALGFAYLQSDGATAATVATVGTTYYIAISVTVAQDATTTNVYRTTVAPRAFD